MRFATQLVMAVLGVALAAYALDCSGMTTPEQAMQCCDSMACSSQSNHGQDCCKTMPAMHAPFVQPSSTSSAASLTSVQVTALAVAPQNIRLDSSRVRVAPNDHAPPGNSASDLTPLRI
jgi:hypothetical protein